MSDYRIKIRVQNNRILSAIEAAGFKGWGQQAEFARFAGMAVTELNALIAMREAPIGENGDFTQAAKTLMEVLGACPSELWTEAQLYAKLKRNTRSMLMSEESARLLAGFKGPDEMASLAEVRDLVHGLMKDSVASPRSRKILVDKASGMTYEQIAQEHGISVPRARQIAATGVRKMRQQFISTVKDAASEPDRGYTDISELCD